jgi:response regulator RpfG family c-di-GMP phosphodiesterase
MSATWDPVRQILVVDDEEAVRILIGRFLSRLGYRATEAASGEEALTAMARDRFDLVLSDVKMPGMNGMSLLAEVRRRYPDTPVLMLTGCENVSTAVDAMKGGAFDYVLKPFRLDQVETSVREALKRQSDLREQAGRLEQLEKTVREQTVQLHTLLGDLNEASEGTLEALVAALDAREHETKAHSRRVAEYTVYLARGMNLPDEAIETIRRGAMLHDIGKIGISDNILLKPSRLTEREWREMQRHPQIGYWILDAVETLRPAAEIVLSHHERFDGRGYPRGLRGEDIPLGARIFSVVDSFDAITSDRPYQRGKPYETAREEIAMNSGVQFDPLMVSAFLHVPAGVWSAIKSRTLAEGSRPLAGLPPMVLESCRLSNL